MRQRAARVPEEVSSCEAAICMGPRSLLSQGQVSRGPAPHSPLSRGQVCGEQGFAPVRGGVDGVSRGQLAAAAIGNAGIKRREGHLVDALALRGDEGRGTLRKARGRCERSVIPGSPNGATHPATGITI